jgi:hypothetical protein
MNSNETKEIVRKAQQKIRNALATLNSLTAQVESVKEIAEKMLGENPDNYDVFVKAQIALINHALEDIDSITYDLGGNDEG